MGGTDDEVDADADVASVWCRLYGVFFITFDNAADAAHTNVMQKGLLNFGILLCAPTGLPRFSLSLCCFWQAGVLWVVSGLELNWPINNRFLAMSCGGSLVGLHQSRRLDDSFVSMYAINGPAVMPLFSELRVQKLERLQNLFCCIGTQLTLLICFCFELREQLLERMQAPFCCVLALGGLLMLESSLSRCGAGLSY
ncbi:hypothetical protein Nepgr_004049 [Nepenthes gracilis]|uniref:Uncharacterized protein n=1 Tax=Nepenthes gracilis TaxID=150966 RepID=A0AAD3S0N3_NEPGR|nr:hypothetical protein Nepgr_004049 [Nepenthes gracilis]